MTARVDHWFDRQRHARLEPGRSSRQAEVRDLRVLVHLPPDAMADELADHRETRVLDVALDGRGDVAQVASRTRLVDADVKRLLGDLEQPPRLGRDLADPDRDADVGPETFEHKAEVEADQVPVSDLAVARDAVDRLVVDGHADRARKAVVAKEAGGRPAIADELV